MSELPELIPTEDWTTHSQKNGTFIPHKNLFQNGSKIECRI